MAFEKLLHVLRKIDTRAIERELPGPKWKEKFDTLKRRFESVATSAHRLAATQTFLTELEGIAEGYQDIYGALAARTELGSKARLNEAVLWADSYGLERSIYLAGSAKEHGLKEPYKTQVMNLPAHACMTRYRQSCMIAAWIRKNLEHAPPKEVAHVLDAWATNFLAQFEYFATEAYVHNRQHAQAVYHRLLASLLLHHTWMGKGHDEAARAYLMQAEQLLHELTEPYDGMHYMHANYLQRAAKEFHTFDELCASHPHIVARLDQLAALTSDVRTVKPAEYFSLTPYVVAGTRAASVVATLSGAAAVFDVDLHTVQQLIAEVWTSVTHRVFELSAVVLPDTLAAIDSGGLAAIDSGGLAAIDSGGLAIHLLSQVGSPVDMASMVQDSGGMAFLQTIDLSKLMA